MDNQNLSHRFWLLIIGLCLAFATGTALTYKFLSSSPYADDGVPAEARAPIAAPRLALFFEPNRGQVAEPVRFLARGTGYSLFLTDTELVTVLRQSGASHDTVRDLPARGDPAPYIPADTALEAAPAQVLRMAFAGANAAPELVGLEPRVGVSNYLRGRDPVGWHSSIPHYGRVRYQGLYDGIDLVLYEERNGADGTGRLQYDFEVAPGADPARIGWRIDGAVAARIDASGALHLTLADGGEIQQRAPHVYQQVDGRKRVIEAAYVLAEPAAGTARPIQVGFQLAAYDPMQPLIIDPVLDYATYLGGSGDDLGRSIAVDSAGRAYVTGRTRSVDFPTTAGAWQPEIAGNYDAFVVRLDADGNTLDYATYLGGSGYDDGSGIAVDSAGRAYVTGHTSSSDFPTTAGALQTKLPAGHSYAFVVRLDADGTAPEYATYLGQRQSDGQAIAVDSAGRAYVTGNTSSSAFPTTAGAPQPVYGGGWTDAFVVRLNADGTALDYATYLGGSGADGGTGIAVDSAGRAYVTGSTGSVNFPTTAGALQPEGAGNYDAFVVRLDADGTALDYATYLGGRYYDYAYGIAVDSAGRAYITGYTYSMVDFPTTAGALQTWFAGWYDAFVVRLDANGSALDYGTYLGGSGDDKGRAIAVDSAGRAYVTGSTWSVNFPTTAGALQPGYGGGDYDAFFVQLDADGAALEYSTYLGGSGGDHGLGLAVDGAGRAYVAGFTSSNNFPTTAGAPQPEYGGGDFDAFVVRLDLQTAYSITPKTIEVPENAGTIIFTVHRADTSKDETLYVSTVQNQGFTNQNDYVGLLNQPLFFAVGQSTQPVPIQINDDAIPEPNETFGLIVQASPTDPIEIFLAAATFTILDNDTAQPSPVFGVSPNDLNFGSVAVNQTSTIKDFTVSNTGSGILSGTCTSSPPFYFAYGPCAYDLAANEFADVPLYFKPTTEGTFAGTVNFSSNVGNIARTVSGTGTTATTPLPVIGVSLESYSFGSVVVGQTSTAQSVTVTNTGTANLNVGTLTLAGDNPGDYLLSTNTCNGANLAPQATCSFAVAFKPTAVGTRTASVSIPSNDPVSPTTSLLLTGSGVETSSDRSVYGIPAEFSFARDMVRGSGVNDVRYLQIILNKDPATQVNSNPKELGSPGFESSNFGDATYVAVSRFQDKYHDAIMPDSPLCRDVSQEEWSTYGCGRVGTKTRAVLNNLIGALKVSEDWGLTVDERKDSIRRVIEARRSSIVPNIEEGLILGAVINEIGSFSFNNEWVRAVNEVIEGKEVLNERDFGRGVMQISSTGYVSTLNSDGEDCKSVNNSSYQCSRYYSNTATGIDRNVTDGLRAFAEKYGESNCDLVTPECQGVADGSPFSETETNVKLYGVCGKRGSYNAKVSQLVTTLPSGVEVTMACDPVFRAIDSLWRYNGRSSAVRCEGLGYVSCLRGHIADGRVSREFGYAVPDESIWLDRLASVTGNYAVVLRIESPANIYVLDQRGRVSGVYENSVREEIPFSRYSAEEEYVEIPLAAGEYEYFVEGFEDGQYGLEILRARDDERNFVRFTGVPIHGDEVHRVVVDWEELAKGGRGVLIERDRFGDGSVVDSFRVGATLQDTTPPTTTPQVVGNMGALGRYNGAVTVTFAADDSEGVGVAATYYALDDGPWVQYRSGVPLVISAGGSHRIGFYSVDFLGNTEAKQQLALRINYPPSADAGPDQTKQCVNTSGAVVTLDGSGSRDPDGDPLTFAWSGPFGNVSGATATVDVPLGTHTISLEVVDGNGAADTDTVQVSVEDRIAPMLQVSVAPETLWPPNNKMVPITVTVTATDACDAAPRVTLKGITSNEPTKPGDIVVDAQGNISLRATRAGQGSGRDYTITYSAEDASGNTAIGSATVTVPHDQRR